MSSWSSICSLCVLPALTHSPLSIHTATWWLPALPWCLQMVPILLPLVTASTVPRAKVSDSPLPPFLSPCPSLPLSHLYTFTPPVPLEHLATFQVRTHFLLLEKNKPALLEARQEQPLWLAMTSSQEDNRCRGLGVCVTINIRDH